MVAVVKEEQLRNVPFTILVTLLGIVMLARPVQFWKAVSPMLVTLEVGVKVMLVRPEFLNILSSILVNPVPIVAVARLVQSLNALLPMLVTLLGIVMLVREVQPWNA